MTRFENYLANLQRFGIQPGLERVRALLARLDEPQKNYPHVLVGGTNGKGSTCEFLARLLAADGAKIGLYTSPHLYRWNERLRVVQQEAGSAKQAGSNPFPDAISDEELDVLFSGAKPHLDAIANELGQPTEFETLTALGFWHFARRGVEAAVLEVGLGGRWDATNVANPWVSVVTHVALDHCDRLGNTLEAIAADKVEIARPGRVLVTAETKESVLNVFRTFCDTESTRFWPILAPDCSNDAENLQSCLNFLDSSPNFQSDNFQRENRQTALAAFYAFQSERRLPFRAPSLTDSSPPVPGRLEIVHESPRVILDVCNNPDGALHLAHALREELKIPRENLILVLGILGDKDFAAMIEHLAPLAKIVIATQSQSPRAAGAETLAEAARKHCAHVESVTPIPAALTRALALSSPHDTICIAGSFTTIGEIERHFFLF